MNEFTHKGLLVSEPYKSYWTDFTVACYDNLQLEQYSGIVDVLFVSEISGGIYGSTFGDESEVCIEIAMFSNGKPIPFHEIQKTIAHEMTHAGQYLSGRLYQFPLHTNCNGDLVCKYRWCGEIFLSPKYSERPWETEATLTEDVLVAGAMYDLRNCNAN